MYMAQEPAEWDHGWWGQFRNTLARTAIVHVSGAGQTAGVERQFHHAVLDANGPVEYAGVISGVGDLGR